MTSFFEIFEPGLRHLHEERDRQRLAVTHPSHGGGAPLGIDLDAGTAVIIVTDDQGDPSGPDNEGQLQQEGSDDDLDQAGADQSAGPA